MGLIYASDESSEMMSALSRNLSIARTTVNELTAGSKRVIDAVDGQTLSGAAYTAGKGLFSELILPTIKRVTTAIEGIQEDLVKYSAANQFVSREGYLDEDKLNLKLELLRRNQNSLMNTASYLNKMVTGTCDPTLSDQYRYMAKSHRRMADSFQEDINKVQDQLRKLRDFASKTNGLFHGRINELNLAMQGVLVLNATTVKANGQYVLPSGKDKSWFTRLRKESRGLDPAKNKELEKYHVFAVVIQDEKGNRRLFWKIEDKATGYCIQNPELYRYVQKTGGNLGSDFVQLMDMDTYHEKIDKAWSEGVNYETGEKLNRVLSGVVRVSQRAEDIYTWANESEIGQALQLLGFTYGTYKLTTVKGVKTIETGTVKKVSETNRVITGSKNGKTYTLDKNKSTGNQTYKKASGAENIMSNADAEKYAFDATKGANNSDSIVLGKFDGGGPTAYTTKAKEVGAQYFELDNWDELSKMYSDKEIWKINEKFLDIQIGSGRDIYFSHNPLDFIGDGSFYSQEIAYLQNHGFGFEKIGDLWHVIR